MLRKQKGLTQEELAEVLYVSRTAVSKWESGRGLPNIESLKALSRFYGVTLDALLSGDDLLHLAETEQKEKDARSRDMLFGLLDCSILLLLFLPFFGQAAGDVTLAVSLLSLKSMSLYLSAGFYTAVIAAAVWGILILALQSCEAPLWVRYRHGVSLVLGAAAVLLFIISRQPYAAVFCFVLLGIKVLFLLKK